MSEQVIRNAMISQITGFMNFIGPTLLFTTIWSGFILGIQGQMKLFNSLLTFILLIPGLLRLLIASTVTDTNNGLFYPSSTGLVQYVEAAKQFQLSQMFNTPKNTLSKGAVDNTLYRYFMVSFGDGVVSVLTFFYSYCVSATAIGDSRNYLSLFLLILGVLLQMTLNGHSFAQIFINIIIGGILGSMYGSSTKSDPKDSPFIIH